MSIRPSIHLPLIATQAPLSDPWDAALTGDHPTGTQFDIIENLPANFGRTNWDEPVSPYAGGIAGVLLPLNYAGHPSFTVYVHRKHGSVNDLVSGWEATPLYWNTGAPTQTVSFRCGMGAQIAGEYLYVSIEYDVQDGSVPFFNRRVLYRLNAVDRVQTRFTFDIPPSNRLGPPIACGMFITDTDPAFVFFYNGLDVWHMRDDGMTNPGYATADDGGVLIERFGQWGTTAYSIVPSGPYDPSVLHTDAGGIVALDGVQAFNAWNSATEWPELWVVCPQYSNPGSMSGNYGFAGWDIFRVPNSSAGSTAVPTGSGWPDDWRGHHYATLGMLPGFDAISDPPTKLTFRFHRDKRLNTMWVTASGSTNSGTYQNVWYARSTDHGASWGGWQRGPVAEITGFTIKSAAPPILTSNAELLMPLRLAAV